MDIHPAAYRHGIEALDIEHAVAHFAYVEGREEDAPWHVLYLDPDRAGNMLEVVVVVADGDGHELVIHAMRMRKGYEELLGPGR